MDISGERSTDKSDDKVKSRSIIKDDDDSDDDGPNPSLDLTFSTEVLRTESGDMIKDIKKKIDEKLGNYNFPDRPVKEINRKLKEKSLKSDKKLKDRDGKSVIDKHRTKLKDKKQMQREKVREMMRKDHQNNFYGGESEEQRAKQKKPVIVRRNQPQPPPLNFSDLLKLAETKSKEKVPEPVFKPPKKKEDERPMTQEEIDRKKRAEEHRKRRQEEEMGPKSKAPAEAPKSKGDSSILKSALTGPQNKNSLQNSSGAKQSTDQKPSKASAAGAKVAGNSGARQSSSGVKKPAPQEESVNPWDRIYGQIKKNNPKPGKHVYSFLLYLQTWCDMLNFVGPIT